MFFLCSRGPWPPSLFHTGDHSVFSRRVRNEPLRQPMHWSKAPLMETCDVLVVGAGPTGLAAALDLVRLGLTVRLIDTKAGPSRLSKALVLHARTMEVFESMGVSDAMDAACLPFVALNVRPLPFLPRIRIDLAGGEWPDTRFPGWRSLPQDSIEEVLQDALDDLRQRVEWHTRLVDLAVSDEGVEAQLQTPTGTRRVQARWLLACDGAHGVTRGLVGIARPLTDLGACFLLADVHSDTTLPQDEGRAIAAREGVALVVPMPQPGSFRLILHVPADTGEPRDPAWYEALLRRRTGVNYRLRDVSWVSLFTLRSGVAERLRSGPVFLLGDAAHLQSPVGGQGLNMGVQDAHNLAWKLAHVHRGWAAPELLDSYEQERLPLARSVVQTTSLATRLLALRLPPIWLTRGLVASVVLRLPWVQRRFGALLGMPGHRYLPGVAVSKHRALGPFRPGTRVPDLQLPDRTLLHSHLHPERRTVFASEPAPETEDHGVPIPAATWEALGLPVTSQVLVRPDRIVASAHPG